MPTIRDRAALAVLTDPTLVVPPVPPGTSGIAWLRASVGRFSTGPAHTRRRALSVERITRIPPASLQRADDEHPVATLARAMGITEPVADLVREIAQAYRPGTGDTRRADAAVEKLIKILSSTNDGPPAAGRGALSGADGGLPAAEIGDPSGGHDELTAARIGVLVQACDATAALIARLRDRPPVEVFRDDPPVPVTKRLATIARVLPGGLTVEAGEEVSVALAGDLAFGAGPRRCPGRAHALALCADGDGGSGGLGGLVGDADLDRAGGYGGGEALGLGAGAAV
jgi:hypothetical protein